MKNKINPNNPSLTTLPILLKITTILFLFSVSIQWVKSQNTQSFQISDSLKNKTYKELYKGLNSNYNDPIKEKIYATAYLNKAKNENDTIRIANAYSQFVSINNSKIAIKYCDSIIDLTKTLDHFEYPGYGYMIKGILSFNLGENEKALDNYLIAQKLSQKHNNIEQLLYIKNAIGDLKNLWGNYQEALDSFKSILRILELQNENKFQNHNRLYLRTLYSISNSYIIGRKYDSAFMYSKKGITESLLKNDSASYYNFVSQTGGIAYYQNNFKMTLDSLDKALPYEKTSNGFLNDHYYRGQIFRKQHKDAKALYHFKKADSIYNASNDVVPEVRDIQEYFVDYYKKNSDIENQLIYIDRLIYVDSIIAHNYKNINETLIKKYDTPKLLSEKEKIITNLKAREKKSSFTIFSLITLVIIILMLFVWLFKKQRVLKERFNNILLKEKQETVSKKISEKPSKELSDISKKIVKSVLLSLKEFEVSNAFLDNNLTLNSLSKSFNTNSNYLSKIINFYKKQNFSSYISDLRIDYCIEHLKTNETFRKYSIKAIAFELGFNNAESFSKAFYKRTGLYPSNFIKEIENNIN
ncbi:helix-turn-helix domain-containing protein [Lutibacter sp.]|uniref:helix-turn-helix domain-containing protein n=1 Tax=Lutibacter sp. TaxID=1925666 RepID=UPI003566CE64